MTVELPPLRKYPRTPHLDGSRTGFGDEDLPVKPWRELIGRRVVVTEKLDGANAAISAGPDGTILLQSRGHYLTGGPRERHFALFKRWARSEAAALRVLLGQRYVLYGEWLYAKHTIFYDRLPHYFVAFDVLETETETFLDSARRAALLAGSPIATAPVLYEGLMADRHRLSGLVGPSTFVSADREKRRDRLAALARARGLDPAQVVRETDTSGAMEGVVIRVEADGVVRSRLKFVLASFLQAVERSDDHWFDRPIIPNQLSPGVDLFGAGDGVGTSDA